MNSIIESEEEMITKKTLKNYLYIDIIDEIINYAFGRKYQYYVTKNINTISKNERIHILKMMIYSLGLDKFKENQYGTKIPFSDINNDMLKRIAYYIKHTKDRENRFDDIAIG